MYPQNLLKTISLDRCPIRYAILYYLYFYSSVVIQRSKLEKKFIYKIQIDNIRKLSAAKYIFIYIDDRPWAHA